MLIPKKIRSELRVVDIPTAKLMPIIELRPDTDYSKQIAYGKRNQATMNAYAKEWRGLNKEEVLGYRKERYAKARAEVEPALNEVMTRIAQLKSYIKEYQQTARQLRKAIRKFR